MLAGTLPLAVDLEAPVVGYVAGITTYSLAGELALARRPRSAEGHGDNAGDASEVEREMTHRPSLAAPPGSLSQPFVMMGA